MEDEKNGKILTAQCSECSEAHTPIPWSPREEPTYADHMAGLVIALQSISEDLHALRLSLQLAFGHVHEAKLDGEDIAQYGAAHPRTVQAGFMHQWINAQLGMMQASQEAQLNRLGADLKAPFHGPKNGGRRR